MNNLTEITLNKKELEVIMDTALTNFKNYSLRFGDNTALCKAYLESIQLYTKKNDIVMQDGKLYKKDNKE